MDAYSVWLISSIVFNYERVCALILLCTAVKWLFNLQNRAKIS